MKKTLDFYVLDSLREYINYKILHDLEGFSNKTGNFYLLPPAQQLISGKVIYASSYKQLVYDQSISGANQISPAAGQTIDYLNGRLLFNSTQGAGPLSRTFAANEVNVYTTTKSEQKLIFEEQIDAVVEGSPLPANSLVTPAVFIRNNTRKNLTHCFGGPEDRVFLFKIVCLLDTMTQLQGVQNIIAESYNNHIPLIDYSYFNSFGDLRAPFNYETIAGNAQKKLFIKDTSFANVTDEFGTVKKNKFVAIGNMELRIVF